MGFTRSTRSASVYVRIEPVIRMYINAIIGAAIHAERRIERAAFRVSPANTATCSNPVNPLKAILLNRFRLTRLSIGNLAEKDGWRATKGRRGLVCG